MRIVVLAIGFVLVLAAPTVAPDARAPDDDATTLRSLTDKRLAAASARDRAFYERLLAPNFLFLAPELPAHDKKQYLDAEFAPAPQAIRKATAVINDFRALVDGDTAVVTYQVTEPTRVGEQTFETKSWRVDTYARVSNAWRLQSMAVSAVPTWPAVATVDPTLYDEYAGTYRLGDDIAIVVTREGDKLMAQVTGQPKSELFPEDATSFFDRSDSPHARTTFERDASGKVVAQVYRSNGQVLRATKVP